MTHKINESEISKLHNNELCFKLKRYGYSNVASFLERFWFGVYENDDWFATK